MTGPEAQAQGATPEAQEPVLVAHDLRRRFGSIEALRGLSLSVRAGEMLGLVGPDGAGKTTAIRLMAGMIRPDSGQVRILSMNPMSSRAELRASLGYMPQQYSLYGDLTVEENLHFFSRMFCLKGSVYKERRERLLGITRLGRFTDRRADALSGGMYKKLALACALLPRPRLLLLDEPTNGVDPVSRRELWALLFELCAEGMAIVVSTPYMDEAARCHRVGLMQGGRFLLEGEPGQLLQGFAHVVAEVQGGSREACLGLLEGHPGVLACSAAGSRLRLVIAGKERPTLAHALAALGAELVDAAPNFEDLFLAATAEAAPMDPAPLDNQGPA